MIRHKTIITNKITIDNKIIFLYNGEKMSEQEINQTILDTLRGAAHEFGKMS